MFYESVRVHTLGVPSLSCMYIVFSAILSSFYNDCNPIFALHEYERLYSSATNQMDLCQLGSVTSEWRYSYHNNSVTFLKLVFQIYRYKVKWGSSPLQAMSNSDSLVELFPPPSVPVLPAKLTRVHLVLRDCQFLDSRRGVLSYDSPSTRMI